MAKPKDVKKAPAISVIIAMYNAEQYVKLCLDNLLNQSFKDFEIIVVDDCSSDKSVDVVSEMAPQFEGRLKLIKLKKNSGFPGLPRNTAMQSARGKYITFVDSDDFISSTALEELYNIAEETQAEVIATEKCFSFKDGDVENISVYTFQRGTFVDRPTFETEDIGERIMRFVNFQTLWWAANKLFRRDFLVKHDIKFPNITAWEDLVFTFTCLLKAKKYLRVPNVFYFYRLRDGSLSHKGRDAVEMTQNMIGSVNAMDKVMTRTEYFNRNPKFRYIFLDWYIQNRLDTICQSLYGIDHLEPFQIDDFFRKVIFSVNPAENVSLLSYFFTKTTHFRIINAAQNIRINELNQKISELQL